MPTLNLKDVTKYIEQNIGTFHAKRLEKLEKLNFKEVLKRKNPYLFKAKNILTAQDLVKNLLDAYLQSQEKTLFGDFLEGVAIFVCQKVFGGVKSRVLSFPKTAIITSLKLSQVRIGAIAAKSKR